jgi:hypothetical protein
VVRVVRRLPFAATISVFVSGNSPSSVSSRAVIAIASARGRFTSNCFSRCIGAVLRRAFYSRIMDLDRERQQREHAAVGREREPALDGRSQRRERVLARRACSAPEHLADLLGERPRRRIGHERDVGVRVELELRFARTTASCSPPSSSTSPRSAACAPVHTRPRPTASTPGASSGRPSATRFTNSS